eukprot:TRINITY_DN33352_c0_g1_i1.p1 TRINITY_DN33352_c0_g1~~TRINITY_DN33352_c0_g1_i1.p1  ORF type:complete len:108 (+),score=40.79 TRINITY_DN33352_c0_g1_i1:53-376(+)
MASTDELACVYAALILHDEGLEVTADKIATLCKAADVSVESFYPGLFATFLTESANIGDLLTNTGGAAAAPAASAAPAGGDAPAAADAKKAPAKEESEEEMEFDMFD